MKLSTRIFLLFYVTLTAYVSIMIIFVVLGFISYKDVADSAHFIFNDEHSRMIAGIVAGILLLINFLFYQTFSVSIAREKVIAFDNPAGRVSVSLIALEDLIKRILGRLSEIKEARPNIKATKKGLQIKLRLTLISETNNIPELTARVQDIVKRKIQDIIGLDEPVLISIYIGKIVSDPIKDKKRFEDTPKTNIPFQGYRA